MEALLENFKLYREESPLQIKQQNNFLRTRISYYSGFYQQLSSFTYLVYN